MKTLIALLSLLGLHLAEAVPHDPFTAEAVSGVVERAVWRGSFELNRVFATAEGDPQNEIIDKVPEHWVLILKDPVGLTDVQRGRVSWAYNRLPIDWHWRNFTKHLQKTHLYLRLAGPKDWPVKVGSKVVVKDLHYRGNDLDGWFTVGEVTIDGRAVKLPAKQERPSWRRVEQGGARQPATSVDSKPEGNEKPEPESEGRSQ